MLKECEMFYKGEKIPQQYYIPIFEYSDKAKEYACQTGNEKKRFLTDIEQVIENTDIIKSVNCFLTTN